MLKVEARTWIRDTKIFRTIGRIVKWTLEKRCKETTEDTLQRGEKTLALTERAGKFKTEG